MKVIVSEGQFKRIVDNSNRWGLIGISEGRPPKFSPEKEDDEIKRIIDNVTQTGEFNFSSNSNPDYQWVNNNRKSADKNKSEKFEGVLNQIKEILITFEDNKLKGILDNVKKTGEFTFNEKINPEYLWLKNGAQAGNEKFKNTLKKIKKIREKFENARIKRIINNVKKTGEFYSSVSNPDYKWLYDRTRYENDKKEKFENALEKISKIKEELGVAREYWGEKTIKEILERMDFTDIPPLGKYKIDKCKNSLTCKQYMFDVYLPYNETNYTINEKIPKTGIIFEYDGLQHFEPIKHFGGDERFLAQIHKDLEKNSYCQNHKPNPIKLVRIPYTSRTRDDIKRDILSALDNPSTFILTGDYPKAGWNK